MTISTTSKVIMNDNESSPNSISIFDFERFGDFFRAYIEVNQPKRRSVSYRGLARKVDGATGQMLHAIAHGKRLPGQGVLHGICDALDLSYSEKQFAELLVGHERADTPSEKEHYAAKLFQFRRDRDGFILEQEHFDNFNDTRHMPIFELLELDDFKSDPEWISKRLTIPTTPAEVFVILKGLERIGLIKWEDGAIKKCVPDIASGSPEEIRRFHRDMLAHAKVAIDDDAVEERAFYGVTMSIDANKIPEARRLIAKFSMEMAALLNVPPKTETYHLAVQLFRLTKPIEK